MPRKKSTLNDSQAANVSDAADGGAAAPSSRKRSIDATDLDATPTKRRRSYRTREALLSEAASATEDTETEGNDEPIGIPTARTSHDAPATAAAAATTPRRRGRPPKAAASQTSTPSKTPTKSIFATPIKSHAAEFTTPRREAADRSARKKSTRALIENVLGDGLDSDDEDADHDVLVREIYEDSDEEDNLASSQSIAPFADLHEGSTTAIAAAVDGRDATTPSKTGRRPGGRAKRARSPTPPRNLPAHELYFMHNKPGRPKTSDNTLGSLAMLTHDEYFSILNDHNHVDRHRDDVEYLENLHAELFPQWIFELSQGYSLCLYGFGSKRNLLQKFAKHLQQQQQQHGAAVAHQTDNDSPLSRRKTIIVNGYTHTTTLREILTCISAAVNPSHKPPSSSPSAMLSSILSQLSLTPLTLTILINSIDANPLRRPTAQSILSQLASHPQIHLVCSADTPDFSLLWDVGIRSAFNFLFHDCTTFAPFTVELDVVDEVHELLGRQARRVNGREGVAFVLKSLPENAKKLFQLLVGEVLIAGMEDEGTSSREDEAAGVEYRMVYNKAVEEFICSSEMAFRTLLKEFHDHQMITSRKDALGTELLSVPFPKDELEAILEDLMA
ncbi:hypothetical protein E4U43_005024 [Claviceps pusilla]|uniref:Origin recognition complex subunit 2 n=1 Tax=Claviceps pusilla TaxID=123648 RepID=A0A9P7N3Y9_9HYPO|nr:hypothetical protein E4U43_005024 [Claviceps pusilla]